MSKRASKPKPRRTRAQKSPGKDFELAVYAFAQTLDPKAEVIFDHKVRDRETGDLQQVDVWINATIGGHTPLSVLVSCKDDARKIDNQKMKAFLGELRSTSASTGIIYSRMGFTRPALKKAKMNGIACCRMYRDQPADLPHLVWLKSFACAPKLSIELPELDQWPFQAWRELLDYVLETSEGRLSIADLIVRNFNEGTREALRSHNVDGNIFPDDWYADVTITAHTFTGVVRLRCHWKRYVGRLEAHLLNGSYSILNDNYRGTLAMPILDMQGSTPGAGWEEISDNPKREGKGVVLCCLLDPRSLAVQMREQLKDRPLR